MRPDSRVLLAVGDDATSHAPHPEYLTRSLCGRPVRAHYRRDDEPVAVCIACHAWAYPAGATR